MQKSEQDFYRIGRVRISITNEKDVIETIKNSIHTCTKGYICVSNMRTVAIANKDDAYQNIMENSIMNTPDGTPLIWCARWWGIRRIEQTCGPHIFPSVLKDNDPSIKHFFLGDTDETLSALTKKATKEYGANIVGTYSPPFKPIEDYDIESMAKIINDSGATIVWTSLRAPKQDFLNAKLVPYLNDGIVCIGVGAAFRSVIGGLRQPNGILQKIGLAGLLFKRPDTSWWQEFKWYVKHSYHLLTYIICIVFKRMIGKKYYE